jgi:predicted nucleic acid-binding protein
MTYALDTNAISYAIRGEGAVGRRLLAVSPNEIVIPSIAMYEILNWRNAPKTAKTLRAKIDAFLAPRWRTSTKRSHVTHRAYIWLWRRGAP